MQESNDSRSEKENEFEVYDSVAEEEKNPEGWKFLEKIEDDLIVKGQDSSGHIYEARVQSSYDEEAVQIFIIFKNNSTGALAYYDITYKWHGKADWQDNQFHNDKSQAIVWWGIQNKMPKDFCRAVWRRSRKVFNNATHHASIYRIVEAEKPKEEPKTTSQDDLFST